MRRRGLAISIAFSGVGVGAIVLLPWLQAIIGQRRLAGRRAGRMGLLVLLVLAPLNLLRAAPAAGHRPAAGRRHRTRAAAAGSRARARTSSIQPGRAIDWTLAARDPHRRASGGSRSAIFCALFAWYAVQVHQTKYLIEVGFTPIVAAWALGIVSVVGIPGQIGFGALSDRIGREWVWRWAASASRSATPR